MADKVRVGIIGCGFIGVYHARAVQACARAELVAAADSGAAALERFSAQFPGVHTSARVEDLASMSELDGVAIGIPNAFHAPVALRMLKSGKHVLLEKPMAMNAREAEKIAGLARQKRLRLQIGHCWRYDTEVNYLKQVVQGRLPGQDCETKGYGIHMNWGPPAGSPGKPRPGRCFGRHGDPCHRHGFLPAGDPARFPCMPSSAPITAV